MRFDVCFFFFFFQAEDGIRDYKVTGVQTCALPIWPILRSFLGEPAVRARYALAGVACTVDAVLGSATLAGYPEAVRQLAVADLVLLTKTDLLGGAQPAAQLRAQVQAINGEAPQGMDPAHHVALLQRLMSEGATGQEDAAAGMLQTPG